MSMAMPPLVVPVVTLRSSNGSIDIGATKEYADRAKGTWFDLFMISGTIGEGGTNSARDRRLVLQTWADAIPRDRLLACVWSDDDLMHAAEIGVRPIVVLRAIPDATAMLEFLQSVPLNGFVYSHPDYTPTTLTAEIAIQARSAAVLPAGGKFSKIELADIPALRAATGAGFFLFDGRSRHIAASIDAGATGAVVVPLAALPASLSAQGDLRSLQIVVDRIQSLVDSRRGAAAQAQLLTELLKLG